MRSLSKDILTLLFDGDMVVFEACSGVETEIDWGDGLWTLHANEEDAMAKIESRIAALTDKVLNKLKYKGEYEIILCFTDDVNFRKKILPTYKANRIGKRKPVCYKGVKAWALEAFTAYQRPNLEADDCIGILATTKKNVVVISGDKDFKSVPGRFYNYRKDEFSVIDLDTANYWHLWQTLVGDTADNYSGCPGIGEKTAEKILSEGATWPCVVKQFEKKGLTEADAMVQARVARILRREDYDMKTREPILWTPKK